MSPPRLEKCKDNNNKERFRWVFEEQEYDKKRYIVTQYCVIQMNITKYNNLTYLTYLLLRYVYRRVPGEEGTEMKLTLCS